MARLYRPHIPLKVRCEVAERQMEQAVHCLPTNEHGVIYRDLPAKSYRMQDRLDAALLHLAHILGCEVSELRLDHDPPLGARRKRRDYKQIRNSFFNEEITKYFPDANDPDHLFYRPHGPQHERSHLVKTNVRGDHGQHPDRVLIKKARKLERGPTAKRGRKIGSPGFYARDTKPKRPWPKRKFQSRRRKP